MSTAQTPTLEEINELVAFLPVLYAEGFNPIQDWKGGLQEDGTIQLPFPVYENQVEAFFHVAAKECWRDYEYVHKNPVQLVNDDRFISSASLDQIKTLLTFCVRGERFCDGHWGAMIDQEYVRRILERLMELQTAVK